MIKAIIFDYGYTIYDPEIKGFQPDAWQKNLVPENKFETPDFTIEKLANVIRIANL